jgi:trk system potassium uptake protein TrkA
MLIKLGIQNNVSPKDIVADSVTSYVRALSNSKGSNIQALYRLVQGQVEALEFSAKKNDKIYGQPLRELKMKNNCLIASIIRNGRVIVPDGNTSIEMGDNVIVVTTHKNFGDLSDIFE